VFAHRFSTDFYLLFLKICLNGSCDSKATLAVNHAEWGKFVAELRDNLKHFLRLGQRQTCESKKARASRLHPAKACFKRAARV